MSIEDFRYIAMQDGKGEDTAAKLEKKSKTDISKLKSFFDDIRLRYGEGMLGSNPYSKYPEMINELRQHTINKPLIIPDLDTNSDEDPEEKKD